MNKLTIVFNNKRITEMMQQFDLFESFKCVIRVIDYKPKNPVTLKKMNDILKQEHDDLQAVLVASIGKGKPKIVYNEDYKVYSIGHAWFTRDDFIKYLKNEQTKRSH